MMEAQLKMEEGGYPVFLHHLGGVFYGANPYRCT